MAFGWLKKLGSGAKKAVAVAAIFDPHMAAVAALIEAVEEAMPDSPGTDKKAAVMAGAMALIQSQLAGLNDEQRAKAAGAVSAFIDAYVAFRNALEAIKHSD